MRLTALNATFLGRYDPVVTGSYYCDDVEHQQGVMFLCPKCFATAGNTNVGVHSVICWFINPLKGPPVPSSAPPGPGRWLRIGTTIDTLTLGPGPTGMDSVLLTSGCGWHGWVKNGDAT